MPRKLGIATFDFIFAGLVGGHHEHYDPGASEILNLFDINTPDGKEHFLAPILLAQMSRWAQDSSNDGFVTPAEIFSYLQALGFSPQQVNWVLNRLVRKNLIESPSKSRENGQSETTLHYRITSVGTYYAKKLITTFSYIDGMVVDTPIVDSEVRGQVRNVHTLKDRLERASIFSDYLSAQWSALADQELAFEWPDIRHQIESDIDYVTGKRTYREDVLDRAATITEQPTNN